ncbi:transmembrane channel-like protein 6 [Chanos chanos]|uniref:Transmembrane channel-like protein n=1 Tax=Chanos chanos TaxID=29144 RepID=A0A6J2WM32_CHACN|nr:transmembrane channel-like protein 6 [Chanos chanos]
MRLCNCLYIYSIFLMNDFVFFSCVGTVNEVTASLEAQDWQSEQSSEEDDLTDVLSRNRRSTATLRVLSSMPSRSAGRRGPAASVYKYQTRATQRRRRWQAQDSESTARGHSTEAMAEEFSDEVAQREELLKSLQSMTDVECVRTLRAMPLSLTEKRKFRDQACRGKRGKTQSMDRVPCCSWLKVNFTKSSTRLWHADLKRVGGRFGTGVLSYFLFLRTLLQYNIFLFLINGLFVVIPQAFQLPAHVTNQNSFSWLDLLTGEGFFRDTLMFYGYYTNSTSMGICNSKQNDDCAAQKGMYNIPLAYLSSIAIAFFVTCTILVYSMSKSFGRSFRIFKSHGNLALKVFCSWDFKVSKKAFIKRQSENICTHLKELLSELNCKKEHRTVQGVLRCLVMHALAWLICLSSTLICVLSIFYFPEYIEQNDFASQYNLGQDIRLLALPVLVSSVNLLLPDLFSIVAWMENYNSPSIQVYVSISRNLLLKVSVVAVLCYHWRVKIYAGVEKDPCWETYVGQELYRFLLLDLIFTVLYTIFGEYIWRFFSKCILRRKSKLVFDIARNVLELIYGQTLVWLGVLFSPLLPAVQIIKLLLLFYLKKTSLMANFQAPIKPWRATQMSTLFVTLLCFPSFLGAAVCVAYTLWTMKPSSECGPFNGHPTMLISGKQWIQQLEGSPGLAWLVWIYTHLVDYPLFLFLIAGVFLSVIYIYTQIIDGQRRIVALLQEQIDNEGEDKKFLITRLQALNEQAPRSP